MYLIVNENDRVLSIGNKAAAFEDIREAEKELEEVKKQLNQEKEDNKLLAELLKE